MGLPVSLTPTLLAAFHPGYICSQRPGAAVVRRSGAKFLATLQLIGCAVFMAAMPSAGNIRSRGLAVGVLSGLMACLGVVQGPMSPVISQLQGAWMPTGVERAIAFRFTGLAHTVSNHWSTAGLLRTIIASFLTTCAAVARHIGGAAVRRVAHDSNR